VRRLILCLAAAACLSGPVLSAGPALAQRWGHDGGDRGDQRRWERGDRGDRGNRWERGRGDRRGDRDGRWDRGDGRWGRGDGDRWRDARGERGWDNERRGPPRDFRAFSPRRGAYLPRGYGGSYVIDDYRRYRLRTPPPGYHWVRVRNDYLLVAIASGLIFDVIAGGY
jgi:Ni/Co efflux regulator RcnB